MASQKVVEIDGKLHKATDILQTVLLRLEELKQSEPVVQYSAKNIEKSITEIFECAKLLREARKDVSNLDFV